MKTFTSTISLLLVLFIFACKSPQSASTSKDDGIIEFVFLHINDVYEIGALEGGTVGGMARIATLRKQLLAKNANTLTVHAGDFLNPSLIGTMKNDGERIRGKQMVEVMNACKIDLVCIGNHEFDLKEEDLQKRINESNFHWLATNVDQVCGEQTYPFYKEVKGKKQFLPETFIWEIKDSDGTAIKVGIFGATIDSNPKDYVHYDDPYEEAKIVYQDLKAQTDVIVGLTHLELDEDMEMAKRLPEVPLLMGGHDHDNMKHTVGTTTITKADANVKTAYVHHLVYNKKNQKVNFKIYARKNKRCHST